MGEPSKARENDHLIEPMFEAFREEGRPVQEGHEFDTTEGASGRTTRPLVTVLIVVFTIAFILWWLLG